MLGWSVDSNGQLGRWRTCVALALVVACSSPSAQQLDEATDELQSALSRFKEKLGNLRVG